LEGKLHTGFARLRREVELLKKRRDALLKAGLSDPKEETKEKSKTSLEKKERRSSSGRKKFKKRGKNSDRSESKGKRRHSREKYLFFLSFARIL